MCSLISLECFRFPKPSSNNIPSDSLGLLPWVAPPCWHLKGGATSLPSSDSTRRVGQIRDSFQNPYLQLHMHLASFFWHRDHSFMSLVTRVVIVRTRSHLSNKEVYVFHRQNCENPLQADTHTHTHTQTTHLSNVSGSTRKAAIVWKRTLSSSRLVGANTPSSAW